MCARVSDDTFVPPPSSCFSLRAAGRTSLVVVSIGDRSGETHVDALDVLMIWAHDLRGRFLRRGDGIAEIRRSRSDAGPGARAISMRARGRRGIGRTGTRSSAASTS